MEIDQRLISHLEKLARLELSNTEREQLREDLNRILEMVEKLQALPTDGVEPLVYINDAPNPLRPDRAEGQIPREAALRNAPQQDGRYFQVPKVIKKQP
jgi:aspartyl-tRNA(Asn)/glutamyl-tRNA(Gln) amidotransferase subunit C